MTSNSQAHYAKGTPSPNKLAPTGCKHMVSGTISLPCSGYFSPFPHGTSSLSVSREYLALPDGTGRFMQDFSGPALLRVPLDYINCTHTRLSLTMVKLSRILLLKIIYSRRGPTTPQRPKSLRFRLFPVRSPLLRESLLFSFPPGTQMFQFPGLAFYRTILLQSIGLPHSEIYGCNGRLHLTVAYRSLPRPSSPPRAKASAMCSL